MMFRYAVLIGNQIFQMKKKFSNILEEIEQNSFSITEMAIAIMCYLMRTQFFNDGNKRTDMLFIIVRKTES